MIYNPRLECGRADAQSFAYDYDNNVIPLALRHDTFRRKVWVVQNVPPGSHMRTSEAVAEMPATGEARRSVPKTRPSMKDACALVVAEVDLASSREAEELYGDDDIGELEAIADGTHPKQRKLDPAALASAKRMATGLLARIRKSSRG